MSVPEVVLGSVEVFDVKSTTDETSSIHSYDIL